MSETAPTAPAPASVARRLSFLDRYLTLWEWTGAVEATIAELVKKAVS